MKKETDELLVGQKYQIRLGGFLENKDIVTGMFIKKTKSLFGTKYWFEIGVCWGNKSHWKELRKVRKRNILYKK